jgi:hypothetical protein
VKRHALSAAATLAVALAFPATAAADWAKTYVVEWYEPAMYYGAKTGVIDPGTDCPAGSAPEIDWLQVMVEAGYTREEAEWLRNPANPTRSPVHGQNQMAFRGKDRANVYINPTSTPETKHLTPVSGKIAEGIDLDGKTSTGFESPTGGRGIDNEFYHALGCWKTYRGPPRLATGPLGMNDGMRNGSWTVAVVVSGKGKDPRNDKDVQVGVYLSPDKLVKDGNGEIAKDYSFRIKPDVKYEAIFKARSKDGVITSTEAAPEVYLRDASYTRELQLLKARVQLEMKEDGSLKGYIGGYRPWAPVYKGWVDARGPVIEALTWVRLPDVYYALRRYADYSPTGPKGEKTHISYATRIDAIPAFVMTPDGAHEVKAVRSFKALAKPDPVDVSTFRVIDGLVPDKNAREQAGPNAVILPPKTEAKPQAAVSTSAASPTR